jgi:hypothetical protein
MPYWAVLQPVPSGPRAVWQALWSFWDGSTSPAPIHPANKTIAARAGGITVSTVRRHLDFLEEIRRISRRGVGRDREILLAWGSPSEIDPRNIAPAGPQYCAGGGAILQPAPRNIAAQILSDLIRELKGVCPPAISPEVIEAIVSIDRQWADDLRAPAWSDSLAEATRALGLTAANVARVLEVWRDTDLSLSSADRLRAQQDGVYPPRREIWWVTRHGAWLRRALAPAGGRASPPAAWIPDPCEDDGRPWAAN